MVSLRIVAHLKPVGNFQVDPVYPFYSFVEDGDGLARLEVVLRVKHGKSADNHRESTGTTSSNQLEGPRGVIIPALTGILCVKRPPWWRGWRRRMRGDYGLCAAETEAVDNARIAMHLKNPERRRRRGGSVWRRCGPGEEHRKVENDGGKLSNSRSGRDWTDRRMLPLPPSTHIRPVPLSAWGMESGVRWPGQGTSQPDHGTLHRPPQL